MKDRNIIIGIIILLLILLGFQQYMIYTANPEDKVLVQIKNLEKRIDSLSNKKDSVKTIIVKLDKDLEYNEKHYEEVVNSIFNVPDSVNRKFIDDYIKQYIERITQE